MIDPFQGMSEPSPGMTVSLPGMTLRPSIVTIEAGIRGPCGVFLLGIHESPYTNTAVVYAQVGVMGSGQDGGGTRCLRTITAVRPQTAV